MGQPRSFSERFEEKIERIPFPGCWLWTAAVSADGYGRVKTKRAPAFSHRVSWALHRGKIPPGQSVLHQCDVRCCVNPAHLFLGTKRENTQDMMRKGRLKTPARRLRAISDDATLGADTLSPGEAADFARSAW